MPKNRIIPVLGALVALIHIIDGLPQAWESFLGIIFGLSIVGLSFWGAIDKKLMLKAKAQQRQSRKFVPSVEVPPGVVPPVTDEFGKRVTDFYPKTGQPGRRLSDLKPTLDQSQSITSEPQDRETQ